MSFVNPHDIAWWHRFTEQIPAESAPPALATALPGNFETPEALEAQRKPLLQRSLQDTAARSFGAVPFTGPEALGWWTGLMNTYLMLQGFLDAQIGTVLSDARRQPLIQQANTIRATQPPSATAGSTAPTGCAAEARSASGGEDQAAAVRVRDFSARGPARPASGARGSPP